MPASPDDEDERALAADRGGEPASSTRGRRHDRRAPAPARAAAAGPLRERERPVRPSGEIERRILLEDLPLERAQRRRRLDPELLVEQRAEVLERGERVRLPAGAIQRDHQPAPERLAERVARDEGLELGGGLDVAPEGEIGLDPLLERRQPEPLDPSRLDRGKRLRELGERVAPPERERLAQPRRSLGGGAARERLPRRPRELLEAGQVELVLTDVDHVTGPERPDPLAGSALRSCETWICTIFGALSGASSPQRSSIRRSVATARFPFSRSRARSARCLPAPSGTGSPSCVTSSGPSSRKRKPRGRRRRARRKTWGSPRSRLK